MTLAVTTWGNGEPLALLHGFTSTAGSFDHLRCLLQDSFRVIAPDRTAPDYRAWQNSDLHQRQFPKYPKSQPILKVLALFV